MARNRSPERFTSEAFIFLIFLIVPPAASTHHAHCHFDRGNASKFEISEDMFWKDGEPFRIIGGDLHYFRVHPEYWEDRLLRAKALGLNTVQTYVPWNLHEPTQGRLVFEGLADIVSFLELCRKLDLLVMLRAGPYICGEWDLGGLPAWLLAKEPAIRLRSSDPAFLDLVENWWGILLPKVAPFLYSNGGPIIMVQVENEFGSYGDDKDYLHYLVGLARKHLGNDTVLYTTDGGTRETLEKGTIPGDAVFSAVDFSTGEDPLPIFKLQKEFNAPGKSPPISTEFYTGWLTHWGETIASTDATSTSSNLENILLNNGSAVLYMAHGGTNFGYYNGANTGSNESEYKADLTSYDYSVMAQRARCENTHIVQGVKCDKWEKFENDHKDAPIRESGDVDNAKYKALRSVIAKYATETLPDIPPDNEKLAYGLIKLDRVSFLFDTISVKDLTHAAESKNPISMEAIGQLFGFVLYASDYTSKGNRSVLRIPKVHDRAQVFVSCPDDSGKRPTYVDVITRWSNRPIQLPDLKCESKRKLFVLVENMGRLNYGPYLFDRKGILSPVYLDGRPLYKWKVLPVSFQNLTIPLTASTELCKEHVCEKLKDKKLDFDPAFYYGNFSIDKVRDTYLSFRGWSKGVVFVNDINIGRFWPSIGPQCNLYVPAPILRQGDNSLVILELESPNADLVVKSVDQTDFSCGRPMSI